MSKCPYTDWCALIYFISYTIVLILCVMVLLLGQLGNRFCLNFKVVNKIHTCVPYTTAMHGKITTGNFLLL